MKLFLVFALTFSLATFADNLSNTNKLFDHAENNYPELFSPANQTTYELNGYLARYYSATNIYIGTKNQEVYVYGDIFNGLKNVGFITGYVETDPIPVEVVNNLNNTNKLFDFAEENYPELFNPANQPTYELNGYLVRYYPATDVYIGTKNQEVYVYDRILNNLKKVGAITDFIEIDPTPNEVVDNIAPVISIISVSSSSSSATLTWNTDELADSNVSYGASNTYENGTISDASSKTSHSITLSELTERTTYHYKIESKDSNGNRAFSTDLTFTTGIQIPSIPGETLDNTAPIISNVNVSSSTSSATLTWNTNEASDSNVSYGTSSAYEKGIINDDSLTTLHTITLSGLTEGTVYHYQIKSKDNSGNNAFSADLIFTTENEVIVDEIAPVISNINVSRTSSSATITWQTNEASDSKVSYGLSNAYENGMNNDDSSKTSHSIALSGLAEDTTYHYQIESKDNNGNSTLSADLTFTTETETTNNTGSELLMFDWNTVITSSNHGFPRDLPPKSSANGDWTSPINYAGGTLYLRAEIKSGGQPVSQTMQFNYCVWQKDLATGENFGLEACTLLSLGGPLQGTAGEVITWSQKISNMTQVSNDPLEWSRGRHSYGVAIKNSAGNPVSDYKDWDWYGEDPAEWYPLDMRFTVVVVPNGQSFSGWNNYVN